MHKCICDADSRGRSTVRRQVGRSVGRRRFKGKSRPGVQPAVKSKTAVTNGRQRAINGLLPIVDQDSAKSAASGICSSLPAGRGVEGDGRTIRESAWKRLDSATDGHSRRQRTNERTLKPRKPFVFHRPTARDLSPSVRPSVRRLLGPSGIQLGSGLHERQGPCRVALAQRRRCAYKLHRIASENTGRSAIHSCSMQLRYSGLFKARMRAPIER